MPDDSNKFQIRLIHWGLLLGTLFLYYPVIHHPYITYDDYYYLDVSQVKAGLTWSGIGWAMSTGLTGNWHPLTWISHMLDCSIYGFKDAGGHHLTNLLFHAANALLMFTLWRRLTGALWRSALVAALFAWHPLHVESVAWVAERKDVLSTFFFLLALLAYARYAEASRTNDPKSKSWYGITLLCFALGLMAKPMIVTLPFVLFLLDFWPLRRISNSIFQTNPESETEAPLTPSLSPSEGERDGVRGTSAGQHSLQKLLLEKIPFFLLSAISSAITYLVQKHGGNMQATASLTFGDRTGAAMLGYAAYLKKTFWPVDLAVFYPFPPFLPRNEVVAAGLLLVVVSVLVILLARRQPWHFTGWFWFVGMLIPVIGLVTVGSQAYADRYTYLPLTGICVAPLWGVHKLILPWPHHKLISAIGAGAILLACAVLTRREVNYWQSSLALFTRAAEVTRDNPVVENNLGLAMDAAGKLEAAEKHYETSLKLVPNFAETWNFLAMNQVAQGNYPGAIECYKQELRLGNESAMLRYHYGNALAAMGDLTNAADNFARALRLNPRDAAAAARLGSVQAKQGKFGPASTAYRQALAIDPDAINALQGLSWILATSPNAELRDGPEAVRLARHAAELTGRKQPLILTALDAALAEAGQFEEAIKTAQETAALAKSLNQDEIANQALARIELYKSGKPFRSTVP